MRFPFHKRFTIETTLPLEEARARLDESIGHTGEPFMGRLQGGTFDITRTSHGRNSARPRIHGQIAEGMHGTTLRGTMKIHEVVIAVFALIVLGPGLLLGQLLIAGVVILLIALFGVAFNHESSRALRMLSDIVEAEKGAFE